MVSARKFVCTRGRPRDPRKKPKSIGKPKESKGTRANATDVRRPWCILSQRHHCITIDDDRPGQRRKRQNNRSLLRCDRYAENKCAVCSNCDAVAPDLCWRLAHPKPTGSECCRPPEPPACCTGYRGGTPNWVAWGAERPRRGSPPATGARYMLLAHISIGKSVRWENKAHDGVGQQGSSQAQLDEKLRIRESLTDAGWPSSEAQNTEGSGWKSSIYNRN